MWHADVFWPPSELIRFSRSLLIFLILALCWLSEAGQIQSTQQFSLELIGEMA